MAHQRLAVLPDDPARVEADGAPASPSFRGVPWALAGGIDVAGWEDVAPSATFTDGRVTGSTGCNRFTAPYTLDARGAHHRRDRDDPDGVHGPRRRGRARVPRGLAGRCGVAHRSRRARAPGRRRRGAAALPGPAPTGSWTATAILAGDAVSSPLAGTEMTATFADDGKLTGSAGCNHYTTTFRANRGSITIAQPAITKKACATPEGVMERERPSSLRSRSRPATASGLKSVAADRGRHVHGDLRASSVPCGALGERALAELAAGRRKRRAAVRPNSLCRPRPARVGSPRPVQRSPSAAPPLEVTS